MQEIFFGISLRKTDRFSEKQITLIRVIKIRTSESQVGPEVIKLFLCSTQLSKKFQLLIKSKMPTNKEVSCFKSLR